MVKLARERESTVLVVKLKIPADDTGVGRKKVKKELLEYVEECFGDTEYGKIYAIGGIGFS